MAQPFVGEIKMFGGNFAISGWAFCNGAIMSIAQNEVLYTLIGTTYGGDGVQTFNLPDLRSRIPVGQGQGPGLSNYGIGQQGGVENVTLTITQMPGHTHPAQCNTGSGTGTTPGGNYWAANANAGAAQFAATPNASMNPNTVSSIGGNQPHPNLMPYLAINYIISLFGIFPSQN